MFVNDHTDNTRVTIEWTLQKRNWTPRNKLTMPSNRVASHYILSSEGDVSSINPLILDPSLYMIIPRGYLLNDERVPHTVSISPNKKDLFHVKSPNKEEDVEIKPSKHSTLADGRISHRIITLFAFFILMTFALAHLSNTIENVVGFKLNDDQDFIFFLFSMLGSLLVAIYWGVGVSLNLYSRLNNAFRFHGIAWSKLVVIKERFPTILDVMEIKKLNDHILILSTDGIHGYNLRKGKTSNHLRHPIALTKRARFCLSTSDNLFAVYDQNRKMVYEKIFKIEGENSLLTCINESDFELQQLKEPDEEGRRFLEPYVGNISIDSILICAPDFTPSRKLCHHAKSQIKIEKAFNYFGISQCYNFDLDNILASPKRIWGIYDVQDKNMMTEIRNWDSLFISDGNITVLGNNLQRIWVDEYEEWDDEKSNAMVFIGMEQTGIRATSKPYGPYYSLTRLRTMLMSNIENSWNSDLYDPSDLRTIHSMDGDHEECILNTMAKTMVDLYPRPNEEVPLCKELIPHLIAKTLQSLITLNRLTRQ